MDDFVNKKALITTTYWNWLPFCCTFIRFMKILVRKPQTSRRHRVLLLLKVRVTTAFRPLS